jgi:hypothetical protein
MFLIDVFPDVPAWRIAEILKELTTKTRRAEAAFAAKENRQ